MAKLIIVFFALIACVFAKPGLIAPIAYSAPLVAPVAPAVVTATSSQYVARNYNGIAAAKLIAPAPLAYTSPLLASPFVYSAPAAVAAAPLKYTAVPAVAAAAPLKYTAAPVLF